jgi:hypothetical protein
MRESQSIASNRVPRRKVSQAARQALCLALLLALPDGAQIGFLRPQMVFSQTVGQHRPSPFSDTDMDVRDPVEQEKQLRALNAERQKSLVSDTNKLLKLATELNAEVSTTNPDSLSGDQLRKLAEIEKLARSVKDKMSTSVRGIPSYEPPVPPRTR